MSKQANQARHDAEALAAAPPDPDYGAVLATARPKVKELLEEYRADPTGDAGAILESLVLSQVAGESAREAEVVGFQQVRDLYHTLENDSGRSATRLARQNRRLKMELAKGKTAHTNVRQYLEAVKADVRKGKEPNLEEIIEKISTAIGLRGPLIPRVEMDARADAGSSQSAIGSRQ
jgi:hypothetical protein